MSSLSEAHDEGESAEAAFRAAFVRLVQGCPRQVPAGTPVTQNNVAREAGRDPSAFKKKRYPELIREIQGHIARVAGTTGVPESEDGGAADASEAGARDSDEAARLREERDSLLVQLLAAKQKIFEQWQLIQRLEKSGDAAIQNLDDWRAGGSNANVN